MSSVRDELEEAVGKQWAGRLALAGAVIALYFAGAFWASVWPFSQAAGVVKRVTAPDAIIQNYEWFYDQYYAIEAQRRNAGILPEGSADQLGTRMVLNSMIAEYNAKSREITRNLWKAPDLPYQIGE